MIEIPSSKERRAVTKTNVPLADRALLLRPDDDVAVTTRELASGTTALTATDDLVLSSDVPRSHKPAVRPVSAGDAVHGCSQTIGRATADIAAGEHVHSPNLGMDVTERAYEFGTGRTRLTASAADTARTFQRYHRENGKIGTRNFIGVPTLVNCSASSATMVADQFCGFALEAFENVDGVVAITHQSARGLVPGSEAANALVRTLMGYAQHPNFGCLLVLGLGCEMVPVRSLVDGPSLPTGTIVHTLTIQDAGGVGATLRAGAERIKEMLPKLDQRCRALAPISELVLGVNCGCSDDFSGITANPALGHASDRLVATGGTSILAEAPEVSRRRAPAHPPCGLRGRRSLPARPDQVEAGTRAGRRRHARQQPVARQQVRRAEDDPGEVSRRRRQGRPGPLTAVYEYAESVTDRGFVLVDTPGYAPVAVTGIVAGGANVVCFTTGRGSVLGCRPTPSIKLATNNEMVDRMAEEMDINCGHIVDGTATLTDVGDETFERIIADASGGRTISEELDLGQDEFIPSQLGTVT